MLKIRLFLLMMAILILFPATTVFADSPAPIRDYSVETPNGEFLFVMLAKDIDDSYNQLGYVEEDETLRKTYPESGMYRNDGSNTPLWTVDWNAFGVILSADGRYLVRWGPWPFQGNYFEIAVEFYRDGKLLKSYKVDDLVFNLTALPHSVSHYRWLEDAGEDLENNTIWIKTYEGRHLVFDMTTGKVIEGRLPIKLTTLICGAGLAMVALPLGLAWRFYQKRKAKQQAAKA
jgi:hypothetical protein